VVPTTLSLTAWRLSDTTWIVLDGELDLEAVREHGEGLRRLTEGTSVVIDARRVTFIDLCGIRLLAEIEERARLRGAELSLIPSHRIHAVAAALEATSLIDAERDPETLLDTDMARAAATAGAPAVQHLLEATAATDIARLVHDEYHRHQALVMRAVYLTARSQRAATRARSLVDAVQRRRETTPVGPSAEST
jgi:anti-anti-sigma factor